MGLALIWLAHPIAQMSFIPLYDLYAAIGATAINNDVFECGIVLI
jgi:hypothetical protein